MLGLVSLVYLQDHVLTNPCDRSSARSRASAPTAVKVYTAVAMLRVCRAARAGRRSARSDWSPCVPSSNRRKGFDWQLVHRHADPPVQVIDSHAWKQLLHNQRAPRLKTKLLFQRGVLVTSVPGGYSRVGEASRQNSVH